MQWRATKTVKGVKYHSYKESLRELAVFSTEIRMFRGTLSMHENY